jgi:hypothetical protein
MKFPVYNKIMVKWVVRKQLEKCVLYLLPRICVLSTQTNSSSQNVMLTRILAPFGGTSGTGTSKLKTQSLILGPGLSILTWRHSLFIFSDVMRLLYKKVITQIDNYTIQWYITIHILRYTHTHTHTHTVTQYTLKFHNTNSNFPLMSVVVKSSKYVPCKTCGHAHVCVCPYQLHTLSTKNNKGPKTGSPQNGHRRWHFVTFELITPPPKRSRSAHRYRVKGRVWVFLSVQLCEDKQQNRRL